MDVLARRNMGVSLPIRKFLPPRGVFNMPTVCLLSYCIIYNIYKYLIIIIKQFLDPGWQNIF